MAKPSLLAIVTDAWGAEGGIAQYNRDLLGALAASGVFAAIEVLAYSRARFVSDEVPDGIRVRNFGSRPRFAWECASARSHDAVFCGHLHLAPLAAFAAWRMRARLWMQAHGIEAWPRPSRTRRRAFDRADLVTSVSRLTRSRIASWSNVRPERLRVLPNTVDTGLFAASCEVARSTDPIIVSIGRLAAGERYKGHDRIIELLPRLRREYPNLRYRIIGDGDDRRRLESLAAMRGVSEAVEFVGRVPRAELPAHLREAAVFAMPSTGEGFGIAFLEAMACGVPAIGLDEDGSRDALGDGDLGIVATQATLLAELTAAISRPQPRNRLAHETSARFGSVAFRRHVAALAQELLAP